MGRGIGLGHRPRVASLLRDQPSLALDELAVRLSAMDWAEPTAALAATAQRLDDRPLLTGGAMNAVSLALIRDQAAWGLGTLDDAADHLIGLGSGTRFDWPDPWRTRLRALRSHPVEDVAVLAERVWTAAE